MKTRITRPGSFTNTITNIYDSDKINIEDEDEDNKKKKKCCFCWKDEDDDFPRCHWESRCPDDIPPCEEED